jgi:hypothetical protein
MQAGDVALARLADCSVRLFNTGSEELLTNLEGPT